ncbi:MAG: DUF1294 domain-containing protein [Oleispira antarctica]|nr:DUF1294 domain-containing protein [Oleispira antarctica]MBQ0794038.1 DUF1294 domain-containing protein [Oleispira antarctica]
MNAIFFLLILFAITAIGWLSFGLTLFYFIASAFTFLMYGLDKLLAVKKRQRVSEKALHFLALIGGWPGAYIGQQIFRHKISKWSFLRKYFLMVFINIIALSVYLIAKYQRGLIDLRFVV